MTSSQGVACISLKISPTLMRTGSQIYLIFQGIVSRELFPRIFLAVKMNLRRKVLELNLEISTISSFTARGYKLMLFNLLGSYCPSVQSFFQRYHEIYH